MTDRDVIRIEDEKTIQVYAKRDLILQRGSKALVWDSKGREYIDCTGSYGTSLIGYCHPRVVDAIKVQAQTLSSCHGFAYNQARSGLIDRLLKIAPKGVDRLFLSNSGSEAVETALKIARRYSGKQEVVAMVGGYHGKTFGALSATWNKKYREPFQPLLSGFIHIPYGRVEKLEEVITKNTAAIILEPIQGENGVRVPPEGYLKEVRKICDTHDSLLILDEIQTGLGRTGKMFACEYENVQPDILCCAKGLAGGLPIGVTLGRDDIMQSIKRSEHSSTYSGNPIVAAAASATIDVIIQEKLTERASELGRYIFDVCHKIFGQQKKIREVRGRGLMIGIDSRFDVLNVILSAMSQGILVLDAGRTVIRLLPPLVISKDQIDRVLNVLRDIFEDKGLDSESNQNV